MLWSKLGLLIPALTVASTVGWLAMAAAQDAVAPPAEAANAQAPAEAPAETPAPEAQAPAQPEQPADVAQESDVPVAEQSPTADATAPEATGAEPASASQVDAAQALAGGEAPASETAATESLQAPVLGAIGYDSEGRAGRIHIVRRGDTLWDISDAYLGTPWVWPSIWNDNDQVENPHRIYPGDHIWITPSEMRKITAEEAAILLSNLPPGSEVEPAAAEEVFPTGDTTPAEPQLAAAPIEHGSLKVSARESSGLISAEQLEGSASIVGRVPERVYLSQEDVVYIGAGEGSVAAGDRLTIFRTREKVFDPDTGKLLGHHVDFIGWLEVTETHPESSLARISMSTGEVEVGDRLIARDPLPEEIAIQPSPVDVEGRISFFPQRRVVIGWNDFVYLNRGKVDGLEVGSPLEVFRSGYPAEETARQETVQVPDRVVATLVVVRATDETAVAVITKAETELRLGDQFRGAPGEVN